MMSAYLSDKLIEVLFGNSGSLSANATIYVALMTAPASCTGSGTEASGTGYAQVTTDSTYWTQVPSNGSRVQNVKTIAFPTPGGSWGTVVGIALYDSSLNLLFSGPIEPALVVTSSTPAPTFLAGQIQLDLCCCC